MALDTFIDNITVLGIEAVLLDKIKDLLSYDHVASLKGECLAEVAGEAPGAQQERDELDGQITVLTEVIRTCKMYKQTSSCSEDNQFMDAKFPLTRNSIFQTCKSHHTRHRKV